MLMVSRSRAGMFPGFAGPAAGVGERRTCSTDAVVGIVQSGHAKGLRVKRRHAESKSTDATAKAAKSAVRPDKVALGRKLVKQTDYPPPEVIAAIAAKLAQQWKPAARRRSF